MNYIIYIFEKMYWTNLDKIIDTKKLTYIKIWNWKEHTYMQEVLERILIDIYDKLSEIYTKIK